MRATRVLVVCLALLSVSVGQSIAAPLTLNHQGRLLDASGAPLSGSYNITFKLYNAPTGGTELWSESQTIDASEGLYQATLGLATPLSSTLFSGPTPALYLGITVGTDTELTPRAQLSSSPYSLHSASVDGFSSGPGNINMGQYSIVGGDQNTNSSDYSSILGGEDNEVNVTEFADSTFDTTGFSPRDFALHPPGSGTILGGHSNIVCGNHAVIVQGWFNFNCAPYSFIGSGFRNQIFAAYSSIGTGLLNDINAGANYSVIGGGAINKSNGFTSVIAGGVFNTTTSGTRGEAIGGGWRNTVARNYSTISGGENNAALADYATVGGGRSDTAFGSYSTVAGGQGNYALSTESFIGGGSGNLVQGQASTIGGGDGNLTSLHDFQYIGGGQTNRGTGPLSTIGGGQSNEATTWATVGGGVLNHALNEYTFIGGGFDNLATGLAAVVSGGMGNVSSNQSSTVGGGDLNNVAGAYSTVGGGRGNIVQADSAVVAGGVGNAAAALGATVGGGTRNLSGGLLSTVGGGVGNMSMGNATTVSGGQDNIAGPGEFATVPGGIENEASAPHSFAAGTAAKADDSCSFVWADCCGLSLTPPNPMPFYSSGPNTFNVRATNGFYFYTFCDSIFDPAIGIGTGVYIPAGGSMWMTGSSRQLKKNISEVDEGDILDRVDKMPIYRWSYKTQDDDIEHIGPMAEDFYETFNVGDNNRTIGAMDPAGVSLAATKALIKENQELKERLSRLESLVSELASKK